MYINLYREFGTEDNDKIYSQKTKILKNSEKIQLRSKCAKEEKEKEQKFIIKCY